MSSRSHAVGEGSVLLVEDKDSLRTMLRHALEAQGHSVLEARDQAEAERCLRTERPALVLSDLKLPVGDGFGVLRAAKDADPDLPVIVMTAYGSIQDAVAAMKEGALDFLAKPVDPDHLRLLVERALAQRRVMMEYALLKDELARKRGAPRIIGNAPALTQVSSALQRAAATDTTVLLEGESGTGKELFARALHALSARAPGPFVPINCAAIPESLLEAEDRSFERLGGTTTIRPDVRVVAATNRVLRRAVASRQFRDDLYFRLSVFPIVIPPLRERRDDVPLLARHFIERACLEIGRRPLALSADAVEALVDYPWPGNVRELQNCLERAVILADGDRIHARTLHLAAPVQVVAHADPWQSVDLSGTLGEATERTRIEAERRKIQQALQQTGGDVGRAADLLEVGYRALLGKIREYGI
ncbi:MAG: sigma-54 dependent transcriptional regulator [Acidobacteria bacterium]|nr:sigma-54 dependent transcriptional regulator [Acidobacteriota bacterium]